MFTKEVTVNGATGSISIYGELTGPGGADYVIDIVKSLTYDETTRVATFDVDASITKNDQEVYFKDITITLDRDDTVPRSRTLIGTVRRHKLTNPDRFVTVAFTDLVYKLALGHRDFISGTADIANQDGSLKAHLVPQPDFSLYGEIRDSTDFVVGSMTVADGVVTIVIS